MTPELKTERLEFRPYRPQDEDAFVGLLRDEEVCRWMGQDQVPEADLRTLFRAVLTEVYPRALFDVWALWHEGEYAGHAEIKPTGNVPGHELITALAPPFWRHGLGSEAVRGLVEYARDTLGLAEAYGLVGAENTASREMCRRLGFRELHELTDEEGRVGVVVVIPTGLSG